MLFRYGLKSKYDIIIKEAQTEAEVIKKNKLLEVKEKFLNKKAEITKKKGEWGLYLHYDLQKIQQPTWYWRSNGSNRSYPEKWCGFSHLSLGYVFCQQGGQPKIKVR